MLFSGLEFGGVLLYFSCGVGCGSSVLDDADTVSVVFFFVPVLKPLSNFQWSPHVKFDRPAILRAVVMVS